MSRAGGMCDMPTDLKLHVPTTAYGPRGKGIVCFSRNGGFTLIEVLVVVAIITLLVALLIPSLKSARMQARIVVVHSDLRQITLSLDAYAMESKDKLPPTRFACGTDVNYQLPVELARKRYLAESASAIPQAAMFDAFNPDHTYKYRAPGPIYQNGWLYDLPGSDSKSKVQPRGKIWVPDDFPKCESLQGRYYHDRDGEPKCPVSYAVWSTGPDRESPKFPRDEDSGVIDENMFPLPRRFWLTSASGTGLITHFRSRTGLHYMSP